MCVRPPANCEPALTLAYIASFSPSINCMGKAWCLAPNATPSCNTLIHPARSVVVGGWLEGQSCVAWGADVHSEHPLPCPHANTRQSLGYVGLICTPQPLPPGGKRVRTDLQPGTNHV